MCWLAGVKLDGARAVGLIIIVQVTLKTQWVKMWALILELVANRLKGI